MNEAQQLESPEKPQFCDVSSVKKLPKDQPFGLFDLDGTLTEPGDELLMATFVRQVKPGSDRVRAKLLRCFDDWSEGKKEYESYLIEIGKLWAQLFADKKVKQSDVIEKEVAEWFRDYGSNEIMRYSGPMMTELRRYQFRPILVTGAPYELAHHFASALKIQHVFAMGAELDSEGFYTGKMRYHHNTGILSNKAAICDEIGKEHTTGFAAGDTQSDTVLMKRAIIAEARNTNDIMGRAFLMNPRPDVLHRMKQSSKEYFDRGLIEVMEQSYTLEHIVEKLRHHLRTVLIKNRREELVYEIEGLEPIQERKGDTEV